MLRERKEGERVYVCVCVCVCVRHQQTRLPVLRKLGFFLSIFVATLSKSYLSSETADVHWDKWFVKDPTAYKEAEPGPGHVHTDTDLIGFYVFITTHSIIAHWSQESWFRVLCPIIWGYTWWLISCSYNKPVLGKSLDHN